MIRKLGFIKTIQGLVKILRGKPNIPPSLADNPVLKVIAHRRSIRSFSA